MFYKFPRTPHLRWLSSSPIKDDRLLSDAQRKDILSSPLIIEEKIDGANLGFSLSEDGKILAQKRGAYIDSVGQFAELDRWLRTHEDHLFDAISTNLILFGEWCAIKHSLYYTKLPDLWIMFDVYDINEEKFYNAERRNTLARNAGVSTVHRIATRRFTEHELLDLLGTDSTYKKGAIEGLVIRSENERWLEKRAKLVRPEFTRISTHWTRKRWVRNTIQRR